MNTLTENTLAAAIPPALSPITFCEAAAAKVAEMIAEEGNPALKLRVYVTGGGCSGFQYGFAFEETVNEDEDRKSVV